jgi:hypothetical protein
MSSRSNLMTQLVLPIICSRRGSELDTWNALLIFHCIRPDHVCPTEFALFKGVRMFPPPCYVQSEMLRSSLGQQHHNDSVMRIPL